MNRSSLLSTRTFAIFFLVALAADLPDHSTYGNPGEESGLTPLAVSVDTFDNGSPNIITKPKAFEPEAQLSANGRAIELTFVVTQAEGDCTPGLLVQVDIILAQESTGAIATGKWVAACGSPANPVVVVHAVKGSASFEARTATACAVRTIRQNGKVKLIETFQWCRDVELKR